MRRVRDHAKLDELFPVWRHHPFLTNNTEPTAQADITHRQHAIIETVFSDNIDGPLAHLPAHWPWADPWQRLWTSVNDPPRAA